MKIAIQSESNVVPTLAVSSGSTQRNAPDFKSALTSAVASSSERSDKASHAQDAKSSPENNKRKDTPAQTSTASVHADALPPATPIGVAQNTIVPSVTTYPNRAASSESFAALANDQKVATVATVNAPNTTVGQSSQAVISGSDRTTAGQAGVDNSAVSALPADLATDDQTSADAPASDAVSDGPSINGSDVHVAPSSSESIIPATVAEAANDAAAVLDDASPALSLTGAATGKVTGQEGISTISSTAPRPTTASSHTEAIDAKQAAPELSTKVSHSLDGTQKKQDPAIGGPVSAAAPSSGTQSLRSQSGEKTATSAETPSTATVTQVKSLSDAAAQAQDANRTASLNAGLQGPSLASGTISSALPGLTPAVDFQGAATASSGKAQNTVHGSAQAAKPSTSVQAASATGSPAKGKDASSDVRDKRGDNANSDSESSNLPASAANASTVAKVPETTTNAGHDSSGPAGTANTTALQIVSPVSQAAGSNLEQTAGQQTGAASSSATHAQGAAAGAGTELQNAPGVSSAQLTQSMHHSEMRLGMQSAEFGDISISTTINRQALSAQISIGHSELSKALAVHLPAIEAKLGSAYGVEARVEVRDGGGTASYSNPGQQSKERSSSQGGSAELGRGMSARMTALNESTTASITASTSRLDIRI